MPPMMASATSRTASPLGYETIDAKEAASCSPSESYAANAKFTASCRARDCRGKSLLRRATY
eukprot:2346305-Lingulodinium_polyedra.AAC.1